MPSEARKDDQIQSTADNDMNDEQMEADFSDEQLKNRSTAKNASCDNFESEEMAKKF